jgi:two-component system, sensor histidine kinase and response regulator
MKKDDVASSILLSDVSEGIAIIQKSHIVWQNEAFYSQLEYDSNKLLNKSITAILAPEYSVSFKQQLQSINASTPPITLNLILLDRHHQELQVEVRLRHITYEGKDAHLFVYKDQTIQRSTARERDLATRLIKEERSIFTKGNVVIFKWRNDPEYTVDYVSPNVVDVMGYTVDDFKSKGISYLEIIAEEDRTTIVKETEKYRTKQADFFEHSDYRVITKTGEPIWLHDFTTVIRDDQHVIQYFLGYVINITNRKHMEQALRESEERFRLLVETMTDGLAIENTQALFEYVNASLCTMLGYERSELIHQPVIDFVHPSSRNTFKKQYEKRRSGALNTYELKWVKKNGQTLETIIAPSAIVDQQGNMNGSFAVITDISELKTREIQIKQLNERLEEQNEELRLANIKLEASHHQLEQKNTALKRSFQELEQVNKELHEAKEMAESANRTKSEFLSVMSHELRTPLNGILGHTQIMLLNKHMSAEYRDSLDVIIKSGKHLLSVINDILDIAAIEAGQERETEDSFSTSELARSVVEIVRGDNPTHLEYRIDVPDMYIKTDKSKIRQVLINLLSNAKKFTPEFGTITVEMQVQGDKLLFKVKDTGVGIPKDKHKSIFEPFYQVDYSSTRDYEGSGLGLALCERLVERLQGEIWVESEPGKGSIFFFTAAYTPQDNELANNATDENPTTKYGIDGVRVLVVDDDPVSLSVVTTLLKKCKVQTLVAHNGHEAVDQLKARYDQIDIVLMDLQMPMMDGFEAIAQIKSNERYWHIPIIAVTAFAREEDKERSRQVGSDDYITKPFGIDELLRTIRKWTRDQEE